MCVCRLRFILLETRYRFVFNYPDKGFGSTVTSVQSDSSLYVCPNVFGSVLYNPAFVPRLGARVHAKAFVERAKHSNTEQCQPLVTVHQECTVVT